MQLFRPSWVMLLLICLATINLNGCSVLGMLADHKIVNEDNRNRPLMEQRHPTSQDAPFGTLGMEADIAIVKKIIDTVKGQPEPVPTRCKMENGLRICYEKGAEGY